MSNSRARVLCVDDERSGLAIRKLLLESRGYSVQTADCPSAALQIAESSDFDLAILDYYMPEMTGGQLAAEMKRRWPKLPILIFSAFQYLPEDAVRHSDASCVKGGPPQELLDKVADLLQHRA